MFGKQRRKTQERHDHELNKNIIKKQIDKETDCPSCKELKLENWELNQEKYKIQKSLSGYENNTIIIIVAIVLYLFYYIFFV